MQWHPDRSEDPQAKEKFAKISASYRLLIDPDSKREYDDWLQSQHRPAAPITMSNNSARHTQSGTLWARSAYADTRADEFRDLRRAARPSSSSSGSGQSYENRHPIFGQQQQRQEDTTSAASSPVRGGRTTGERAGHYTSTEDPLWMRQRERDMEEHDRVRVRRNFLQEDRLKFGFAAAILLGLMLRSFAGSSKRRDD